MKTELILPESTLSLNVLRKMHKNDYKRLRDRYQYEIKGQHHYLHKGPVKMTVVRICCRDFDYDNYVGGAKPLIDAIVLAGIIRGDKPKDIVVRDYQQLRSVDKQERVFITIEDL